MCNRYLLHSYILAQINPQKYTHSIFTAFSTDSCHTTFNLNTIIANGNGLFKQTKHAQRLLAYHLQIYKSNIVTSENTDNYRISIIS